MISPTYGNVSNEDVVQIIIRHIKEHGADKQYKIIVGTDSQNFHETKMVLVLALVNVGNGGIFFYDIQYLPQIRNLKEKIFTETYHSLQYAQTIIELFEKEFDNIGFDYTNINFSIHVDVGNNGKTKDVLPDIVQWVQTYGFNCETKPESFVASSIADKYSK